MLLNNFFKILLKGVTMKPNSFIKKIFISVIFFCLLSFPNLFSQPCSPILVEPPTEQTGTSTIPIFQWESVTNAVEYEIQISDILIFPNDVLVDAFVFTNEYDYNSGSTSLNSYTTYYWKVRASDGDSWGNWSDIYSFTTGSSNRLINPNNLTKSFSLLQNYPNPFNPITIIVFNVENETNVKLIVYDVLGRMVEKLVDKKIKGGKHEISWNAGHFPSGIYFYKIITNEFTDTKKMLLVK
jgi:hypothetical protein